MSKSRKALLTPREGEEKKRRHEKTTLEYLSKVRKAPLMPIKTVEKPITIAINNEMKYCFLYLFTAQLSTSCKKKEEEEWEQEQIKKIR